MKKILPKMTTDEEVESLLNEDLSDYLHSDNFKQVSFEFKPKDKTVNLRVSEELLTRVKTVAKKEGIPYQRYIRRAIEKSLGE
ncbi:CopG family antitoxin [Iningainema tapete]|uniref:CopG family transcriptional regulator n=1 Tax=Iningainema tapete BLCC-T55 TaxID=2748662 RepID=A0A8J7BWG4_9CYAN|nr:CopG family antitoxin [Iningainema tapete]MBD2770913.1 CopG family transcriptional regulator [Iningainema tapete BLCC-T55]